MLRAFTTEELETLRANPHVKTAYRTRVSFTANFKRDYLIRYEAGENGRDILRSYGVEPDLLGDSRIWSLAGKFRGELDKHGSFSDVRRTSEYDPEAATLEQLRAEVAYVKQEVEFLKKNIILDLEAQRKGSRRVAQTRNLNLSEVLSVETTTG